jgi:hypothetical protein
MGNWEDRDKFEVALLKLTGSAKLFYQGCPELHKPNATWQTFKEQFRKRYRDIRTDQYHYMRLQMARQGKHEDAQQFADHCRALSQQIVCQVADPSVCC